jgi:hypothetical protein
MSSYHVIVRVGIVVLGVIAVGVILAAIGVLVGLIPYPGR